MSKSSITQLPYCLYLAFIKHPQPQHLPDISWCSPAALGAGDADSGLLALGSGRCVARAMGEWLRAGSKRRFVACLIRSGRGFLAGGRIKVFLDQ